MFDTEVELITISCTAEVFGLGGVVDHRHLVAAHFDHRLQSDVAQGQRRRVADDHQRSTRHRRLGRAVDAAGPAAAAHPAAARPSGHRAAARAAAAAAARAAGVTGPAAAAHSAAAHRAAHAAGATGPAAAAAIPAATRAAAAPRSARTAHAARAAHPSRTAAGVATGTARGVAAARAAGDLDRGADTIDEAVRTARGQRQGQRQRGRAPQARDDFLLEKVVEDTGFYPCHRRIPGRHEGRP